MCWWFQDDEPDPKNARENRDYDNMVKSGEPSYRPGHGLQYKVAGCCGRPVSPECVGGCICPQCGKTFKEYQR